MNSYCYTNIAMEFSPGKYFYLHIEVNQVIPDQSFTKPIIVTFYHFQT